MPVSHIVASLLASPAIRRALDFLRNDQEAVARELKEIALTPGAPFREREARSPLYREKLERLGLQNCRIDSDDNAYGFIPGAGGSGKILVEAHLDTVFDASTPLAVTEKEGRLFCPGIGDDAAGLAVLLSVLRAVRQTGLKPVLTVLAGGTSGEEGEGDLRGIKALLRGHPDLAACLSLEPGDLGAITKDAIGSKRYEFIFTGPGGHSWHAYGLPSPIHAMGRAIAKMAAVEVPANPRATYTVGLVEGGTSINSIANRAACKLDMRSGDAEALERLETRMLALAGQALEEENIFRAASGQKLVLEIKPIGNRPAGNQADDAPIVQASQAVHEALGISPRIDAPSSTNANAPISVGVPAVVVRTGGTTGGGHSLEEWFDPKGSHVGAQATLLLMFTLAGLQGVTDPLDP